MAADTEEDGKIQMQSIFKLLSKLLKSEKKCAKICVSLVRTIVENDFSVGSCSSVEYAVRRLIRGLGSARLHIQCVSYAALSVFLKQEDVELDFVLNTIDNELKELENSAFYAGSVMACGAVLEAGMYNKITPDDQKMLLNKMFVLEEARSYLPALTASFIVPLIENTDNDFKNIVWPIIKARLQKLTGNLCIDHLYLLLFCFDRYPKIVQSFIIKRYTSVNEFYLNIFMYGSQGKAEHKILELFGAHLCKDESVLANFWEYQSMKSENSNIAKDPAMISLIHNIFKNVNTADSVLVILTPKIIELLIKVLTFKGRPQKTDPTLKKGKECLDFIVNILKEKGSDSLRMKIIKKLSFFPGNIKFDLLTSSKCVSHIISQLTVKSLSKITSMFHDIVYNDTKKVVNKAGEEDVWHSKERQHVLQMLVKIINIPALQKEADWILAELQFLFEAGFIKNTKLSIDLQNCARESFYRAVEFQMPKLEDLLSILGKLMTFINGKIESKVLIIDDAGLVTWEKVMTTVKKLKNKTGNKPFVVLHLLLIHMGLQVLKDDKQADLSIADLLTCYKKLKGKSDEGENEELHWTEVTIDLLLSLLSKDDRLWRHVTSCIFPYIVEHMTDTGLHQIVEALDPLSEKNILSHIDSEESDNEGSDAEKEELSESESEEENMDEGEEDETVNDKLRMAVREALGYSAALTDDESVDMDEMDEAEEKRLNESLASAFRLFKMKQGKKNKKQSKEDEAQTHFRNRVLDLVEIYISNTPTMTGCLDLLLPLLSLLETAIKDHHQKPLQNRLERILCKLAQVHKFRSIDQVDTELILTTFKAVVHREDVAALTYVEMSPKISECCAFLVRCSQLLSSAEEILVEEYQTLLKSYFSSRDSRLPISLFASVLRMLWVGNWKLVNTLYDVLAQQDLRPLKKSKAVDLLLVFYNNDRLQTSASKKHVKHLNKVEQHFVTNFIPSVSFITGKKMVIELFSKLLSLVNKAYKSSVRHREGKSLSVWSEFVTALNSMDILITHNKTRAMLYQLSSAFNIEPPKAKVTNGLPSVEITEEETEATEETVVKKKKKKLKKMNLKKQSQDLRFAISSQGLESVNFASVDLNGLNGEESSSEPETSKKRKFASTQMNGSDKPQTVKKKKIKK